MAISTACCKISGCTGSFNRTESLYTEEKSRRCSVGYTIADRSSRYQVFGVCFGFDFDISDSSWTIVKIHDNKTGNFIETMSSDDFYAENDGFDDEEEDY